jgi:hypothetical protein
LKGVKEVFTSAQIVIFLIIMLACGTLYGFVETFLFVFLKEDLHAPIFLLGLTITTGALVSIPFLYYSDTIVKKCGVINVIAWALLMYGVRYVGYSYTSCAWYAFPFEALEVFTFATLQVAAAQFIKDNSPAGALALLTGLYGGAHNGFGKGMGGLIGGIIIDSTKSTKTAFFCFGIGAFVMGVVWFVLAWSFKLCNKKKNTLKPKCSEEDIKNGEVIAKEPFLVEREIGDGVELTEVAEDENQLMTSDNSTMEEDSSSLDLH